MAVTGEVRRLCVKTFGVTSPHSTFEIYKFFPQRFTPTMGPRGLAAFPMAPAIPPPATYSYLANSPLVNQISFAP